MRCSGPIAGVVALAAFLVLPPALAAEDSAALDAARRLARDGLIADTHIDVPYRLHDKWADVTRATADGDFDLPRARAGGLDVAFMSIYTPAELEQEGGSWQLANQLIDSVEAIAARAPADFAVVRSTKEIARNAGNGKVLLALGMENGSPIEGKLENLRHFFDRGVRYITLAHGKVNHISDSSYDTERRWDGLSPFGLEVVREMNRLGIMVDVSHLSDAAVVDVLAASSAPVIASHSSARHFTPGFERNLSDELIRAIARKGGVVQVNFGSAFLTARANAYSTRFQADRDKWAEETGKPKDGPEAERFEADYRERSPYPYSGVGDVADHIDHIAKIAGVDHVGLGSDYDGVGDSLPVGLKSVADYPNLIAELTRRGWKPADIHKLLGGNLLRVWNKVEKRAKALRP